MRIRSVRPEFWDDPTIGKLSIPARLLYIGLWNVADDEGRFRWNTFRIHGDIFPFDQALDVGSLLDELVEYGRILRYEVGGDPFGWLPRFKDYQRPNRPSPSKLPEYSVRDHGGVTEDSVSTPKGQPITGDLDHSVRDHGGLSEGSLLDIVDSSSSSSSSRRTEVEKLDASVLSISEEKSDPETGLSVWVDEDGIQRKREDLLWLAVAEFHGRPTDAEEGKFGKALKNLRKARVRPDEYGNLIAAYVAKNGDGVADPTVITIATRVGELRNYLQRGRLRLPSQEDQDLENWGNE